MKKLFWGTISSILLGLNAMAQIQPPSISFVSIDPMTNDISISWYKSPESAIDSMNLKYITQYSPLKGVPFKSYTQNNDGTFSVNVASLKAIGSTTVDKPLSFSCDAYINGNGSTNLSKYHTTIFAKSTFQHCPKAMKISWTKYNGPGVTVQRYSVYAFINNVKTKLVNLSSTDTNYTHYLSSQIGDCCYYIEAELTDSKGAKHISTSNKTCSHVDVQTVPSVLYANYATTLNNDSIELSFTIDMSADIKHFRLLRATKYDGNYNVFAGKDTVITQSPFKFIDTKKDIALNRYFYKLQAMGECGDVKASSNIASNIVLTSESTSKYNLEVWNAYQDWPQGAIRYELKRAIDSNPFQVISNDTVNHSNYDYFDEMEMLSADGNKQCYYVTAYPVDPLIADAKSVSNISCIIREDRVFVPEAFNPVSKIETNKTFKPFIAFVDEKSYEFTVFNRYSEAIFTTKDFSQAWDGTFKNALVSEGTYIYLIKYKNAEGKMLEKRGTFNVIFNDK